MAQALEASARQAGKGECCRAVAVVVRPDIMWSRSRASEITAQAEQLERIIKLAGEREMPSGGLSIEYAEELVADIRAGRDSR